MSLKRTVTPEDVVALLNEMLDIDPVATQLLVKQRIRCNHKMKKHNDLQINLDNNNDPKVGLLGVLNGLFGKSPKGYGFILAQISEGGQYLKFIVKRPAE